MSFFEQLHPQQVWEGVSSEASGLRKKVVVDADLKQARALGLARKPLQVLALLSLGFIDKREIAEQIGITPNAIGRHVRTLQRALGGDPARVAREENLIRVQRLEQ